MVIFKYIYNYIETHVDLLMNLNIRKQKEKFLTLTIVIHVNVIFTDLP